MPKIVPIVEGDGELEAVPILLRRILFEHIQNFDWQVSRPKKAHSLPVLRKKLAEYIRYAQIEPECAGILILLDLDDGCPEEEACNLAIEIRNLSPSYPVAVVMAHREYEAWFLASLETLAGEYDLPAGLTYEGNVEDLRGVKEWISRHMPAGKIYKETIHQPSMSRQIDLHNSSGRSRSFNRLLSAVEQILHPPEGISRLNPYVTPDRCDN